MWTLRKKYLQPLWYSISGPFVYHPLVLVLVQKLISVSMIWVMAILFGCSLILQELSAFFNVF